MLRGLPSHRDDLKSVLAKSGPQLQVGLLLEALGQAAEFERDMSRKYSLSVRNTMSPCRVGSCDEVRD